MAPARLKGRENIDSLAAQERAGFRRVAKQGLNDKRGLPISPAGMVCRSAGASITTRFSGPGT
jgi:hypothetical protein